MRYKREKIKELIDEAIESPSMKLASAFSNIAIAMMMFNDRMKQGGK